MDKFTIEMETADVPLRIFQFPSEKAGYIFAALRRAEARWRIDKERSERNAEIASVAGSPDWHQRPM